MGHTRSIAGVSGDAVSEWTIDTLKEHLEKLIDAKAQGIKDALEEREKALTLQATEYERRLDDLNHEKNRNEEAAKTFVTYGVLYSSYIAFIAFVSICVAIAAIYYRQ